MSGITQSVFGVMIGGVAYDDRTDPLNPDTDADGLIDGEDIKALSRYIVANPLRAGLVENIGEYSHWDAIWL